VVVTRPAPQPPAPPQPPPASPAAAPPPAAPPHPFPTPSVPFPPAPQADAARGTLSFAALFTTPRRAGAGSSFGGPDDEPGAATLAEVENAIRERRFTTAIRTAAQGVSDVLGGLEVIERSDAARAALLGVDGRDYLRLLRLSRLPEGMAGERDALFALHVLIGVRLKADSI
jgi:hypothetical protein